MEALKKSNYENIFKQLSKMDKNTEKSKVEDIEKPSYFEEDNKKRDSFL